LSIFAGSGSTRSDFVNVFLDLLDFKSGRVCLQAPDFGCTTLATTAAAVYIPKNNILQIVALQEIE